MPETWLLSADSAVLDALLLSFTFGCCGLLSVADLVVEALLAVSDDLAELA